MDGHELIKNEITKKIRQEEEKALSLAFAEAAKNKDRQADIRGWESLDPEGWT